MSPAPVRLVPAPEERGVVVGFYPDTAPAARRLE